MVGDPPYGVRAGGRKSGGRKRNNDGSVPRVPDKFKNDHIPSTVPYPFSECMDGTCWEFPKSGDTYVCRLGSP